MRWEMVNRYCFSLKTDKESVNREVKKIMSILKGRIQNEALLFDLRVIISELVINAMSHGNKWKPNKKVEVIVEIYDDKISVSVSDEGEGIRLPQYSTKHFKPSGRGLKLVRGLSDKIFIEDNTIKCFLYL